MILQEEIKSYALTLHSFTIQLSLVIEKTSEQLVAQWSK